MNALSPKHSTKLVQFSVLNTEIWVSVFKESWRSSLPVHRINFMHRIKFDFTQIIFHDLNGLELKEVIYGRFAPFN